MFERVTIKNFKSVQDIGIELGRCTVFIGANGSGKSNILEALALLGAAAADKLDHEFLASRGIRVPTTTQHMTAAFTANALPTQIDVAIYPKEPGQGPPSYRCEIIGLPGPYPRWFDKHGAGWRAAQLPGIVERVEDVQASQEQAGITTPGHLRAWRRIKTDYETIASFVIYSPEARQLRNFEAEGQILPLGIHGEGLFRLLHTSLSSDSEAMSHLTKLLGVFDWFRGIDLSSNGAAERAITIYDRFLAKDLERFDQRSANEGFLYLLFYFALFLSTETPSFFGLDNIDDSLNPRLSAATVASLVKLARETNKQFLATTHQAGILDGLNLHDPEQILYVVFRNVDGHTTVSRVKPPSSKDIRLSEAFLRGYLGGLPNNF